MRVVLADLKSDRGFVSKDTVVGGYGSRLDPFSRVTSVISYLKKQFHDVPSVHMAYIAAILARAGHEVKWTRDELMDGDVAVVLSSLVDHKNETGMSALAVSLTGLRSSFWGRDDPEIIKRGIQYGYEHLGTNAVRCSGTRP